MTVLTQEELVEVAARGRCVCSHLRLFHDNPLPQCDYCDCEDFEPEPSPKTFSDGARVRVRPIDPSVWQQAYIGRIGTVERTGVSDDSLNRHLLGMCFVLFDGWLDGYWVSPHDLEAVRV